MIKISILVCDCELVDSKLTRSNCSVQALASLCVQKRVLHVQSSLQAVAKWVIIRGMSGKGNMEPGSIFP